MLTGIAFGLAGVLSLMVFRWVEPWAQKAGLMDMPNDERKLHQKPIPLIGGAMIFAAAIPAFLVAWDGTGWNGFSSMGVCLLLFLVLGTLDDYLDVSARPKLGLQFLISTVHVFYFTQGTVDFMGLFGMGELDPMWSKIFLSLMFVFLINAFNLIDGVNTLFGLFALLAFLFFAFFFEMIGDGDRYLMAIVVAGALLGFLWYNKTPAKVFMGDAGSLMLGFILSDFGSQFLFHHHKVEEARLTFMKDYTPVIALALFALPIFDMLRVIYLRLRSGKLPMSPGRDHMHHFLLDRGFTHIMTSLTLNCKSLIILMLCLVMARMGWNINVIFGVLLLTAWLLFPGSGRSWIARVFKAQTPSKS